MNKQKLIKEAIALIEKKTGKKVTLKEDVSSFDKNKKSVALTTKQLERNPNEVDKLTKKGFDIKLTDLKEDSFDAELQDIVNKDEKTELLLDSEGDASFDEMVENSNFEEYSKIWLRNLDTEKIERILKRKVTDEDVIELKKAVFNKLGEKL